MIKPLLAVFLALAFSVAAVEAKTRNIPDDEAPVATIDLPDDWDQEEVADGVAGASADGAVFLSVVAVPNTKTREAEIDDTFRMLKEHNVEINEDTKKENKFKINNLEAEELLYQGKDEDGPAGVSITFVPLKAHLIVITYWVTTAKEPEHQEEVGKIVNSLKPAKAAKPAK